MGLFWNCRRNGGLYLGSPTNRPLGRVFYRFTLDFFGYLCRGDVFFGHLVLLLMQITGDFGLTIGIATLLI